jgi:type I restriction enzyme M protein
VDTVDKERVKDDRRFVLGVPKADNANYLWIQAFCSALNGQGRAGFVMANSASDARGSEMEIRRQLVEDRTVDAMFAIGPNFFYTVTLPVTLWFLDRGKKHTDRADKVLFVDARHIYRQLDRAHRDFTPERGEFLANVVRLYRGGEPEFNSDDEHYDPDVSMRMLKDAFPDGRYADVPGLCKVATLADIEQHGWSLNPGRYVGVADRAPDEFVFVERLEELNEELELLNADARDLEERIGINVAAVLEARP